MCSSSNRRHGGRERLTAADKLRMDSVSILLEETRSKLDEVADYLVDFKDIKEAIAPTLGGGGGGGGAGSAAASAAAAAAAAAGAEQQREEHASQWQQGAAAAAGSRLRTQDGERGSTGGHGSSAYSSHANSST